MREDAHINDSSNGHDRPRPVRSESLERLAPKVLHGFFTREGGFSRDIYNGLNVGLGSGDAAENVHANRELLLAGLGAPDVRLVTVHQVHSDEVAVVNSPWSDEERPRADAMVTDRANIAIAILTADCGPVLLADGEAGVIGAAHAGWKGALGGILEKTVASMESIGASRERIFAVLGPTIGPQSYEVGPEFIARFVAENQSNERYFATSDRQGHAFFDLPGYILGRLDQSGVNAGWTGQCTYADEGRFFSYRRATHRSESDYGRQAAVITIRN